MSRRQPSRGSDAQAADSPLGENILQAWATNDRITTFLIEQIPDELWGAALPGMPRRTIQMVAGHLHNARCMWLRTLGRPHGIAVPVAVDRHRVRRSQVTRALGRSGRGIAELLAFGIERGGRIPPTAAYVWRNLSLDVAHVLTYFVAHEGHHRGQIVMAARQLGHRLPHEVTDELWQWRSR